MAKASPSQRAGALLKRLGYAVGVLEKWNPHGGAHGIRQDLFGFLDLLAIRRGARPLYLQVTSWANTSSRVDKIVDGGDDNLRETRRHAARILCASPSANVEVWGMKPGRTPRSKHNLKRIRITYDWRSGDFTLHETTCNTADLKARE